MKFNKYSFKEWWLPVLIILGVCLAVLGTSPLFKTNPWDDTNAMLTMGRSMLHGTVPYRDVIDQRGPILYMIFALGAAIKGNSFFGVFVLQVINIFIIYRLSFEIAKDFKIKIVKPKWAALLGPMALISTNAFMLSGSPEEFAFTSILYLLYIINHYHQRIELIPLKTYFLLGLNLSLIFWNKYSMIGAFVVFFVWVAYVLLRKKEYQVLRQIVIASVLGFLSISIVVLIYFAIHGAVGDLFKTYFVLNLTSYGASPQTGLMKFWNFLFLVAQEIREYLLVVMIIVAGWIKAIFEKKNVSLEVGMFAGSLLFVAMQHWVSSYYNLVWIVFLIVALMRLLQFKIPRRFYSNKKTAYIFNLLIASCLIFLPLANNYTDLSRLVVKGNKLSLNSSQYVAQPQFAKIMHAESKGKQPTLLMINDLDQGFFLSANIFPTTRYWQRLNMNYQQLPQMYLSFKNNMDKKKVDFVIVKLAGTPNKLQIDLNTQVQSAIDPHLYDSLNKNYRINSMAQNNPNESFILYQKK